MGELVVTGSCGDAGPGRSRTAPRVAALEMGPADASPSHAMQISAKSLVQCGIARRADVDGRPPRSRLSTHKPPPNGIFSRIPEGPGGIGPPLPLSGGACLGFWG
eukprot:scaffold21911_cov99-Isochrysis_galbana.AAC.2